MNKIVFIADFFVDQIKGGAEIYDSILIELFRADNIEVVTFKNSDITANHVRLYRECNNHFIVSNFCMMSEEVMKELVENPGSYSILEHDHKYLKTRDPSQFKDNLAPDSQIIHRPLYLNAKNVFAQSKAHAECIKRNLQIENVINLRMSLWTDEQLNILLNNIDNPKQADTSVVNSRNPTKNTEGSIRFCKEKSLEYTLIGSPDYAEFIRQLSSHEAHAFIPRVYESFNRVLIEARMLNCKVYTTGLNGCVSEDWFKQYKGRELIEFARHSRPRIYNDIKEALAREPKKETQQPAEITVILNAYRRPYNLKMQIEALRKQTVKPKQIWLWVNAHDDNEGFDFASLDLDRIIHNDYNWKFYGRFAAALLADTEYLALFDDDTIPGKRWLENCMKTMSTHEGILGSAGIILKSAQYINHDRCGWPTQNENTTEVDLVGHAWFFKREWLRYLWQEKPTTWDNGEDIQFAFMAKIYGDIPTYCPPHPSSDKSLHGSIMGNELGIDNKATSTNSAVSHAQFFSERDACVRAGLKKGWKTVKDVKT